jgi:prevent-host-death family protein
MEPTVTVRRLQRETPAVLREVEEQERSVIITRDGEEIARIVPLSRAERMWRAWVRQAGGDPDDPQYRRHPDAQPVQVPGARVSEALAELRSAER